MIKKKKDKKKKTYLNIITPKGKQKTHSSVTCTFPNICLAMLNAIYHSGYYSGLYTKRMFVKET